MTRVRRPLGESDHPALHSRRREKEFYDWQAQIQERKRKRVPREYMDPKSLATDEEVSRMHAWQTDPTVNINARLRTPCVRLLWPS